MYFHPLLRIWFPKDNYVWAQIKILHETEKAILVCADCRKIWIAKLQIRDIRIRKGWFEVYVRGNIIN